MQGCLDFSFISLSRLIITYLLEWRFDSRCSLPQGQALALPTHHSSPGSSGVHLDTHCDLAHSLKLLYKSQLLKVFSLQLVCSQADDWSETTWKANHITIKLETVSHMAEQFSWVPLPCCSLPGRPFPIKSLALSAHVSPQTIRFRVLDKSPLSGPGRGPPSCNR